MAFPDTQFAGLNLVDFTDGSDPKTFWSAAFSALNDAELIGLTTELRAGQFRTVFNDTGDVLSKGDLVKISGFDAVNGVPEVAKAQADAEANFADGVVLSDIADQAVGIIVKRYGLTGLDTSSFVILDDVFLDASTPGAFTKIEPSNSQRVGRITVVNETTGEVEFDVARGGGVGLSAPDDITIEDTGAVLRVKALGINAAQLAALAVQTAKIANNAVTINKLSVTVQDIRNVKDADEARSTDTVLADDDDLQNSLVVAQHLIRVVLFINQAGATAGIKLRLNFTGTLTASAFSMTDTGVDNKTFNNDSSNLAREIANNTFILTMGATGNYLVVLEGWLDVSGSGLLSIQWAQNMSDAGATTMQKGSHWSIRPV